MEELFSVARKLADALGAGRSLVHDLAALSAQFTSKRSQRSAGYMNDAQFRRAYLGWFTPLNAVRVAALLDRLQSEGCLDLGPMRAIADLGAGPLSASIGVALAHKDLAHVYALDRSARALSEGRQLLAELFPNLKDVHSQVVDLHRSPAPLPPNQFDLVVIANTLGELADPRRGAKVREAVVRGALRALRPDGRLLIIEPAMRVQSQALMQLRDHLEQEKWAAVLSPCPRLHRCSLRGGGNDWCHQELEQQLPQSARALARAAGLAGEQLQLSHLLLARPEISAPAPSFRLVGGLMRHGDVERRYACTEQGLVVLTATSRRLPAAVAQPLRGSALGSLPKGVTREKR